MDALQLIVAMYFMLSAAVIGINLWNSIDKDTE
jgi:hypothetical protein